MTASDATFGAPRRSAIREFGSAVATIMVKELRSRMRGRRAFVVLTAYLAVLALIAYGVYVVIAPFARVSAGQSGAIAAANASALIGQWIFAVLSVLQVILVCMIAPAFTAGQISLEREKQTLDLLITTPLRPSAIIVGKLLTALAFVILMVVAAIPISALVLMYGGASVDDIVRQQVVLLAAAIGFGAIGIFASALTKRTQAATVLTYGTVIGLTLGTAMVFAFWNEVARADNPFPAANADAAPEQLRYLNPMVGMLDVIAPVEVGGPTRFTRPLYELFGQDLAIAAIAGGGVCEGVDCPPLDPVGRPVDQFGQPLARTNYWWPRVAISFVLVALVLTLVSMRLVVPTGMRGLLPKRRPPLDADWPITAMDDPAPHVEELPEPKP